MPHPAITPEALPDSLLAEIQAARRAGMDADELSQIIGEITRTAEYFSRVYPAEPASSAAARAAAQTIARRAATTLRGRVDHGLTVAQAMQRSGYSESYVRHLMSEGSWPSIRTNGRVRIPSFVFGPAGEVPHIRDVCLAAKNAGWSVYTLAMFLHRPKDYLPASSGNTPLDWLQDGRDPVWVLDEIGPPV